MDDLPHLFEELMAFVAVVDAGGFNAAGEGGDPARVCVVGLWTILHT